MSLDAQEIGGLFAAAGGGAILVETIKALFQRGKMDADAAKVITDAATTLLLPLQKRAEELEEDVKELRAQLADAQTALRDTMRQLQSANWELEQLRRRVQRHSDALDRGEEGPTRPGTARS